MEPVSRGRHRLRRHPVAQRPDDLVSSSLVKVKNGQRLGCFVASSKVAWIHVTPKVTATRRRKSSRQRVATRRLACRHCPSRPLGRSRPRGNGRGFISNVIAHRVAVTTARSTNRVITLSVLGDHRVTNRPWLSRQALWSGHRCSCGGRQPWARTASGAQYAAITARGATGS